ncbi:MAG: hypothetical protein OER86_01795, partial [Phycisphaerae bacterium]|nr:hypothetical protein [Phycisphaerae bacterium]
LMPLAELVVMTRPGDTSKADEVTRLYAQGWGLFQFLFKKRHNDLRTYLRALRQQPPGPRDPKLLRKEFERAFGPAATVQAQFRRYIGQMK